MIQRIQSIFLLLAAASGLALIALPFASVPQAQASSSLFRDGLYNVQDNIALMVIFGLAGALCLIAIFLFRKRSSQLRLTRFALVLDIIGIILGAVLFMRDAPHMSASVNPNDEVGAYLPLAFLLFAILAMRFIRKDDKLVRSMDRLR